MSVLYSNFIVNEKNKVIFAYVPKVACSNWKGIMRSLNGAENYLDTNLAHDKNRSGLTYLSNLDNKDYYLKGDEYKKYAFVRNPYSRILSAYLNKVESRIGKELKEDDHFDVVFQNIENYRKSHLQKRYPHICFEVFLYWLKESKSPYVYDEHWKSQSLLLDINNIEFDMLGKFEELAEKAPVFIRLLGAEVPFPTQKDIKFSPTKAISKVDKYFNSIAYQLVNTIYEDDFENFNYRMKLDVSKPTVTSFEVFNTQARKIYFNEGTHVIDEPIVLDSFDELCGAGRAKTVLKVKGSFKGPVIQTKRMLQNIKNVAWYFEDGVPVRFTIKDLTIDLSEWNPSYVDDISLGISNIYTASIGLYGKCYSVNEVTVLNSPGDAFVSICSSQGGKKDFYLDSPESHIDKLEIVKAKGKGFVFAGPHDSLIKEVITCHTKGKGVHIIADKQFSGACDIDFIHAYASDDIAIDIDAKVKARFLQGDTGRVAGVRLAGSNKTIVETVEAFKTRGTESDFSVVIECAEAQIGAVRIRADAGASGLYLGGFGNTIVSLNLESNKKHSDFKNLEISDTCLPVMIAGNQNTINSGRIHFGSSPILDTAGDSVKRFSCFLIANGSKDAVAYDKSKFQNSEIEFKLYGK